MAAAAAAATLTLPPSLARTRSPSSPKRLISPSAPESSSYPSQFSLSVALPQPPNPIPAIRQRLLKETQLFPDDDDELLHLWRRLLRLAARNGDAELAKAVHASLAKNPLGPRLEEENGCERFLWNCLISAYSKLGLLSDARQVFEEMHSRDVVSFTCLISAYAKSGMAEEALELFLEMQRRGIQANSFSLVAVLTCCIRDPGLLLGHQLHAMAVKLPGQFSSTHVQNALMAAYVGSGSPGLAEKVFDGMAERDAASWNTVISGAVKHGASGRAMELFREMRKTGWAGDSFTLSCLIGGAVAVRCGAVQMVHAHAVKTGLELEVSVGNSLMAFYAKLGSEDGVLDLFERMPERDSISWNEMIRGLLVSGSVETATRAFKRCPVKNGVTYNTLIAGLIQNEEPVLALNLFLEMVEKGVELSDYTLSAAITAAGKVPGVCEQLHAFATKSGGSSDDWVAAALLSTYGRCGRTDLAEKTFQKWEHDQSRVVAATALLSARSGELRPCEALDLFRQMAGEPLMMDRVSITTALRLSGELGFADLGRQLHGYLCKSGEHLTDTQAQNSLLSMYARCGNMEDATRVFSSMADHDVVSWNALISGHVLHRLGDEALRLWQAMEEEGIEPDPETFRLLITAWKFARGGSVSDCNLLLERAPVAVNYAMTLDAMGACGELGTATELARSMPDSLHAWAALLRRSSGELQQEAARNVLMAEPESVAEHILAANLYAAAGRWRCAEAARKKMKEKGLRKWPAQSWVIAGATIESFYARDKAHERSRDIYASLEVLIREGIKHGYEPDTRFVLQEVEEFQKREFVFTHSAKLAVAYGHMVEPLGKAIRVMKNVRLCGDCHDFLKVFSVITGREVLLRDTTGFHHFCHGRCSCADRW